MLPFRVIPNAGRVSRGFTFGFPFDQPPKKARSPGGMPNSLALRETIPESCAKPPKILGGGEISGFQLLEKTIK